MTTQISAETQAPYTANTPTIGDRVKALAALIQDLEQQAQARACGPDTYLRQAEGNARAALDSLTRRVEEWAAAEGDPDLADSRKNTRRNSVLEARNELLRRLLDWRNAETSKVKRAVINGYIIQLDELAAYYG